MEINQTGITQKYVYTCSATREETKEVHPDKYEKAAEIDINKDFFLDEKEIKRYLVKEELLRDPSEFAVDEENITDNFKLDLQNKHPMSITAYPSYKEFMTQMKDLEKKYPDLAKTVSLGKTAEGREIMALRIGKDGKDDKSNKPGILITGLHHAREWMTLATAQNVATNLLENYGTDEQVKHRVDSAEIWVVPLVNPDGYEYSRSKDSFWRKNRRPVYPSDVDPALAEFMTPGGDGTLGYGVDPNRNYYDGNPDHMKFYRPPGDTPSSIDDDFSASSDIPRRETFRGPYGNSEKETQAIMNLWMNKKNIKAIVNHHSYGKLILYPWSASNEAVENKDTYIEIANKMSNAMGEEKYTVKQSSREYLASGIMDDFAHLNNKLAFTLEIGESFHEDESKIESTSRLVYNADMALLDWVIDHKEEKK